MGEFSGQEKRPNLYEHIAPERRFVWIANTILKNSGESPEGSNQAVAVKWPRNPTDHYYVLRGHVVYGIVPTFFYALEHHLTELPADKPMTRYVVSTVDGEAISAIGIYDAEGTVKKLNDEARKEALAELIGVLTDASPKEAGEIFANIIQRKFENLAGAYVLSHLAIEDEQEEMSEYRALDATGDFLERTKIIEQKILGKSEKKDSTDKHSFIEEAVATRRSRTDKNEYRPVDVLAAATRVAREIRFAEGRYWKSTVRPDQ